MEAIITFGIPEFNSIGTKEIKFKEQSTAENGFNEIIKSLNKKLSKNWISIEFDFNGDTFMISKHWLLETNFNFELSHQIIE